MADEQHTTDGGPPVVEPRPTGPGRWLRWGSVFVDIEPPAAANPWTTPGAQPLHPPHDVVPAETPSDSRRNALLFGLAAVVAAVLGFLLVAAFTHNDRPPVLAVTPSTTRPRLATTTRPSFAPSTSPTTAPRPSTAPTTAASAPPTTVPAGATTTAGRGGGPITIPEGVPPSAPVAPVAPTTAAPSTTTTTAGTRAFLGVTVEQLLGDGVTVVEVLPSTGAAAAGLLPGDVITAVDATAVASPDELGAAIVSHRPGDSVTVSVLRNGATVTVRATLGVR